MGHDGQGKGFLSKLYRDECLFLQGFHFLSTQRHLFHIGFFRAMIDIFSPLLYNRSLKM